MFPHIRNNNISQLTDICSQGLKPPTRQSSIIHQSLIKNEFPARVAFGKSILQGHENPLSHLHEDEAPVQTDKLTPQPQASRVVLSYGYLWLINYQGAINAYLCGQLYYVIPGYTMLYLMIPCYTWGHAMLDHLIPDYTLLYHAIASNYCTMNKKDNQ